MSFLLIIKGLLLYITSAVQIRIQDNYASHSKMSRKILIVLKARVNLIWIEIIYYKTARVNYLFHTDSPIILYLFHLKIFYKIRAFNAPNF